MVDFAKLTARRGWPPVGLSLVLVVFVVIAWGIGDPVLERVVTEALIYVVVVVGLYIFVGNSGIVSFGHISFMLIGAYATAWQTCCPGLKPLFMTGLPPFLMETSVPVLPAALISGLLASAFAVVIGIPLMRLSGIAASIALFAVLVVMKSIYENWDPWTGGATSIIGLPIYVDKFVALAWAAVAIGVAYLYQGTRFGLILRASREDEVAARAAGINVYLLRLGALALSAFFVGIGGVLYGHYLGTISVDVFWLDMTFISLAMLILGGMSSLAGAVLGVVSVTILIELLRRIEQGFEVGSVTISAPSGLQEIVLALAMVAVLVFRPAGLLGGREFTWPFRASNAPRPTKPPSIF